MLISIPANLMWGVATGALTDQEKIQVGVSFWLKHDLAVCFGVINGFVMFSNLNGARSYFVTSEE